MPPSNITLRYSLAKFDTFITKKEIKIFVLLYFSNSFSWTFVFWNIKVIRNMCNESVPVVNVEERCGLFIFSLFETLTFNIMDLKRRHSLTSVADSCQRFIDKIHHLLPYNFNENKTNLFDENQKSSKLVVPIDHKGDSFCTDQF